MDRLWQPVSKYHLQANISFSNPSLLPLSQSENHNFKGEKNPQELLLHNIFKKEKRKEESKII